MFNKLQDRFTKLTGQSYDGHSSPEDYYNNISNTGFNKTVESKTGKATMGQPAVTKSVTAKPAATSKRNQEALKYLE
jgi:hypothetical protein